MPSKKVHNRFQGLAEVECIDTATWVRNTLNPQDLNILYLDIEGAEYEVMPYLIAEDVMSYFSIVSWEAHWSKMSNRSDMRTRQIQIKQWLDAHNILVVPYHDDFAITEAQAQQTTPGGEPPGVAVSSAETCCS